MADRKWALGLQSRAPPADVMGEVCRALQALDVRWKKLSAYTVRGRWAAPAGTGMRRRGGVLGGEPMHLLAVGGGEGDGAAGMMVDDDVAERDASRLRFHMMHIEMQVRKCTRRLKSEASHDAHGDAGEEMV